MRGRVPWPLSVLVMGLATVPITLSVIVMGLAGSSGAAYPLCRLWSWLLLRLHGVSWSIEGAELVPDGPCVVISNHVSHFDGPALIVAMPHPVYFVIKKELTRIPLWGQAAVALGFVPVDRKRSDVARQQMERATGTVRQGRHVLVFAEGTRSADGVLQPFKKGGFHLALAAGVPILPVAVTGSRAVLPKGASRPRRGHITVRVGEPVATEGCGGEALAELLAITRARIAALDAGEDDARPVFYELVRRRSA